MLLMKLTAKKDPAIKIIRIKSFMVSLQTVKKDSAQIVENSF